MQQAGRDTGSMGGGLRARDAEGPTGLVSGSRKVSRPNGRRAAGRFQLACVRLAWSGPKHGTLWELDGVTSVATATLEAEAARALVEMAEAGDGDNLRRLLRPDPASEAVSWTVSCYRIGDLVPHSLRDFTDPVEALTTLTDCGDADHLAAELVASTPGGPCWVALVRTGEQVRFQILDARSVLARPGHHSRPDDEDEEAALSVARAHWAEVVASWHARQGPPGRIPEAGVGSSSVGNEALSWEDEASADPALLFAASPLGPLPIGAAPWTREPLAEVVDTLNELVDAVSGIASVVERLERSMGAVATRLDAALQAQPGLRPVPRIPAAHAAGPDVSESFYEPGHHWWTPKHRVVRQRPPVDGAPAEPL